MIGRIKDWLLKMKLNKKYGKSITKPPRKCKGCKYLKYYRGFPVCKNKTFKCDRAKAVAVNDTSNE